VCIGCVGFCGAGLDGDVGMKVEMEEIGECFMWNGSFVLDLFLNCS